MRLGVPGLGVVATSVVVLVAGTVATNVIGRRVTAGVAAPARILERP